MKGLHSKYLVYEQPDNEDLPLAERLEWSPVDTPCFVLRYDKDPHAQAALAAYAYSVADENPELANDLYKELDKYEGNDGDAAADN